MEMEERLDKAIEVPEESSEESDTNLEENLKKMINTIMRM